MKIFNYKNKYLIVIAFMVFTNTLLSQTHTWNDDGSLTVSGGEYKVYTKVSETMDLAFQEMKRMNFAVPFMEKLSVDPFADTGFLELADKGSEGFAQLSIFQFDPTKPNGEGNLIYGVRATKNGKDNEYWIHDISPGNWFGVVQSKSTDVKKNLSATSVISNHPDCVTHFSRRHAGGWALVAAGVFIGAAIVFAPFTDGASLLLLEAITVPEGVTATQAAITTVVAGGGTATATIGTGSYFINNDFPEQCIQSVIDQPVVIQLKVKNATVKNIRIPGPETTFESVTPKDLFYEEPVDYSWSITNGQATPTMFLDGNDLEIRGNQTAPAAGDVGIEEVVMEVWGKMLVHNGGTPPEINADYDYGLWIADDLVSENFHMFPKETWADHVFYKDYKLPNLEELNAYIQKNKHLPEIPSLKDLKDNGGYTQHNFNVKILEKIEMLTLYKIEQNAKISELDSIISKSRKTLNNFKQSSVIKGNN